MPDNARSGSIPTTERATNTRRLLRMIGPDFEVTRGRALPLGATVERGGVNFAVFSEHAARVTLVIFSKHSRTPIAEFPLDSRFNRTGNIWHAFVGGLNSGTGYGYRIEGDLSSSVSFLAFDPTHVLLDPYGRALTRYTDPVGTQRRSVVMADHFDWEQDEPPAIPLADSIIYELHVCAFTRHESADVVSPGTFAGLVEKIPYLKDLGVTAVELMPIFEFDEFDNARTNPATGERLHNAWGYHPLSFFAPHLTYAGTPYCLVALHELKRMVKAFHAAGMEVILDAVFNHTGEARRGDAISSFRGIDNPVYYMLDPVTGDDRNYSGCGNTLNCNHPVVRNLILDCLRYWVTEVHIDGVRFDLASIMGRGPDGSVLLNPPLIADISADPVLANIKLIAEAWDAAGLYQVGEFSAGGRWAEWNGKFRDDLRRFVRGDEGMVSSLATRLAGSADLFQNDGRSPYHSVNFVTCHDGFTLADLVSYDQKHNRNNGEDCRDGADENFSWNCGAEGPTDDASITRLRRRQQRNLATLLMVSHGVPMLLYGDETGRTQLGNNNAYCHIGPVGQLNWDVNKTDQPLLTFFRALIAFRREHRSLRRGSFVAEPNQPYVKLEWHGTRLNAPDWSHSSRSLALQILDHDEHGEVVDRIFVMANAFWEHLPFDLPQAEGWHWNRFVDTTIEACSDATDLGTEGALNSQDSYEVGPRSTVVLLGQRSAK